MKTIHGTNYPKKHKKNLPDNVRTNIIDLELYSF